MKQTNKQPCQMRISYLAKISFKNDGKIKTFSDKQNPRKFINIKSALTKNAKESPLSSNERTVQNS